MSDKRELIDRGKLEEVLDEQKGHHEDQMDEWFNMGIDRAIECVEQAPAVTDEAAKLRMALQQACSDKRECPQLYSYECPFAQDERSQRPDEELPCMMEEEERQPECWVAALIGEAEGEAIALASARPATERSGKGGNAQASDD